MANLFRRSATPGSVDRVSLSQKARKEVERDARAAASAHARNGQHAGQATVTAYAAEAEAAIQIANTEHHRAVEPLLEIMAHYLDTPYGAPPPHGALGAPARRARAVNQTWAAARDGAEMALQQFDQLVKMHTDHIAGIRHVAATRISYFTEKYTEWHPRSARLELPMSDDLPRQMITISAVTVVEETRALLAADRAAERR